MSKGWLEVRIFAINLSWRDDGKIVMVVRKETPPLKAYSLLQLGYLISLSFCPLLNTLSMNYFSSLLFTFHFETGSHWP